MGRGFVPLEVAIFFLSFFWTIVFLAKMPGIVSIWAM